MAVVTVGYQQEPQVLVVTDDTNQETQYFQLPQRVVVLEPVSYTHLDVYKRQQQC